MKAPSLTRCLAALLFFSGLLCADQLPYEAHPIPPQTLGTGGQTTTIDLGNVFALDGVTGPIVEFDYTVAGNYAATMFMELFPAAAPQTVSNFLTYVNSRRYDNTFIHRAIPDFVIQGGGYSVPTDSNSPATHILTDPPVVNEFNQSNLAGTVAMAKVDGDLNSATSEWFVNLVDNPGLDADGQKFAVFARMLGLGLDLCKSIAALEILHLDSPLDDLPVSTNTTTNNSYYIVLSSVRVVPLLILDSAVSGYLELAVSTSDSNIVVPEITPAGLKLTSGPNAGDATVAIQATDLYGRNATTTFSTHTVAPPPVTYSISTVARPASYGTLRGGGTYVVGTRVTVRAIPKARHKFKSWMKNGKVVSTKPAYSFVAGESRTLVATFK